MLRSRAFVLFVVKKEKQKIGYGHIYQEKVIGFLMDLVLWTIIARKKLPDTEKNK